MLWNVKKKGPRRCRIPWGGFGYFFRKFGKINLIYTNKPKFGCEKGIDSSKGFQSKKRERGFYEDGLDGEQGQGTERGS